MASDIGRWWVVYIWSRSVDDVFYNRSMRSARSGERPKGAKPSAREVVGRAPIGPAPARPPRLGRREAAVRVRCGCGRSIPPSSLRRMPRMVATIYKHHTIPFITAYKRTEQTIARSALFSDRPFRTRACPKNNISTDPATVLCSGPVHLSPMRTSFPHPSSMTVSSSSSISPSPADRSWQAALPCASERC